MTFVYFLRPNHDKPVSCHMRKNKGEDQPTHLQAELFLYHSLPRHENGTKLGASGKLNPTIIFGSNNVRKAAHIFQQKETPYVCNI